MESIDKELLVSVVSSMLDYQETKIWYIQAQDYVKICTIPVDNTAETTVAEYLMNHVPGIKGIEPVHRLDTQVSMLRSVSNLQQAKN